MKNNLRSIMYLALVVALAFVSCEKKSCGKQTEEEITSSEIGDESPDLNFKAGNYESKVTIALEKPGDYDFYTKGAIEYLLNVEVVAAIDYGNGERDSWAKKTVKGNSEDFDMAKKCSKDRKGDYDKKIVKPLVKTENCKYIVEGVIKYFKDGKWIATVDYGNGTCDDVATKTWNGGSKTISLSGKK